MPSNSKKAFAKLFVGNVGVQIITLAFYPLLTRRYSPQEFGLFGVVNSIVQILAVYSWGQLHAALPSIQSHEEQNEVFSLALVLNFFSSSLILLVVTILYVSLDIEAYYLAIPFAVLAYGWLEINKMWTVTNDKLGFQSFVVNINRMVSNILKLFGNSALMLILSEVIANLITVGAFFKYSSKSFFRISLSWKKTREIIAKHKDFPLFYSFYVLAQILGTEAITIYLKQHLSENELGLFYLGNKFFVQTALILSGTLAYSFIPKLTHDVAARLKVYKITMIIYFIGLILPSILFFVDYSKAVEFVFGSKWVGLSEVINYFIFLTPLKIASGFLASILLIERRVKFISIFKFTQFLFLILILNNGFIDLKQFLIIYVPFELIMDSLYMIIGYRLVKTANRF